LEKTKKGENKMKKRVLRKAIKNGKVVWESVELPKYDLSEVLLKLSDNEYIERLSDLNYVYYLIRLRSKGTISTKVQNNLSLWAENTMIQPIPFGSINWNNPIHVGLAIIGCIGDLLKIYYRTSKASPSRNIEKDLEAMLKVYSNPKERRYQRKDLTPLYTVAKAILRGEN